MQFVRCWKNKVLSMCIFIEPGSIGGKSLGWVSFFFVGPLACSSDIRYGRLLPKVSSTKSCPPQSVVGTVGIGMGLQRPVPTLRLPLTNGGLPFLAVTTPWNVRTAVKHEPTLACIVARPSLLVCHFHNNWVTWLSWARRHAAHNPPQVSHGTAWLVLGGP